MGNLGAIVCPFCGITTQSYSSIRVQRQRTCSNCKKKFFYHRRAYYIKLDDFQSLNPTLREKILLLLEKSLNKFKH